MYKVQGLLLNYKIFGMPADKNNDRFESYPRPTETDKQLQDQPEFIDQQPNDFHDKSISDMPVVKARQKESDDPAEGTKE